MPYAVVGGQAVALWVATTRACRRADHQGRGPADPPRRSASGPCRRSVGRDGLFRSHGRGHVSDRGDPNPRCRPLRFGLGEWVRPNYELPSRPRRCTRQEDLRAIQAVSCPGTGLVKLLSTATRTRHLREYDRRRTRGRDTGWTAAESWPASLRHYCPNPTGRTCDARP